MGLSGSIVEFPLDEVVSFVSQSCKTGVLRVRRVSDGSEVGSVHFNRGLMVSHEVGGIEGAREALFALMAVREGEFSFDSAPPPPEAYRGVEVAPIVSEWREAATFVPPGVASARLVANLDAPTVELSAAEWRLLAGLTGQGEGSRTRLVDRVAQASGMSSVEAIQAMAGLVKRGLLVLYPSGEAEDSPSHTEPEPPSVEVSHTEPEPPSLGVSHTEPEPPSLEASHTEPEPASVEVSHTEPEPPSAEAELPEPEPPPGLAPLRPRGPVAPDTASSKPGIGLPRLSLVREWTAMTRGDAVGEAPPQTSPVRHVPGAAPAQVDQPPPASAQAESPLLEAAHPEPEAEPPTPVHEALSVADQAEPPLHIDEPPQAADQAEPPLHIDEPPQAADQAEPDPAQSLRPEAADLASALSGYPVSGPPPPPGPPVVAVAPGYDPSGGSVVAGAGAGTSPNGSENDPADQPQVSDGGSGAGESGAGGGGSEEAGEGDLLKWFLSSTQ